MTFDLSDLDALQSAQDEGRDVKIVHPVTGVELGITITVAGPDSARIKVLQRKMIDARISQKKLRATMNAEELEKQGIKTLAECIIAWSGVMLDKIVLDCTAENAEKVLMRFPFIREQVDAVAGDRASFFQT